jgi:hypothetical protein
MTSSGVVLTVPFPPDQYRKLLSLWKELWRLAPEQRCVVLAVREERGFEE